MKIVFSATLFAVALATVAPAQRPLPKGMTPEIQAAIDKGLEHLRSTQGSDGAWRAGEGNMAYPTAMTALAGMAFLGQGSTPTRGRYFPQVRRAVDYLCSVARANGLIASPAEEGQSMFGHGFATMFLAQVYGMEEHEARQIRLQKILQRAVQLTARSQSQAGGWLYTPDSNHDEGSVTITQIQALRACRNAGITVPAQTVRRAVAYIRNSANADGSIRYRASDQGGGRAPITAAAVAVLYNAGRYDDPMAEKALVYAQRHLAINGSGNYHHYYSQLYLSQALYQRGGDDWTRHYGRLSKWLLGEQRRNGSWMGDGVGTTYGTAIALTVLQLPKALVPIYLR